MVNVLDMIPKLFLVGAIIAEIGSLGRAEYNLPIFLFGYISWNYLENQKLIIIVLYMYSTFMDLFWFLMISM